MSWRLTAASKAVRTSLYAAAIVLHHVVTGPGAGVPLLGLSILAVVVLAGQKELDGTADPFQAFSSLAT